MKEKFFNFCEKYLVGPASIKLKENLYINFPKTAYYMVGGVLMFGIGQALTSSLVLGLALIGLLTGFFSFFYYNIFPNRLPKK